MAPIVSRRLQTMDLSHQYVRSAPVPLAVVAHDGHGILAASRAFAAAVGVDADSLAQRTLPELFADPDAVRERLDAVRSGRAATSAGPATDRQGRSLLLTIWSLDNAPEDDPAAGADLGILASAGARATPEGGGELAQTIQEVNEALLLTALREQAHAREARAESEAKSVFLASVSHELRTPLNSILGYADLLTAGVPERLPEALRGHVDRIERASRHLLSLIEQIIEASRAEFDQEVRSERLDLRALLVEVADLVRPQAGNKEIRVETRLPDGAVEIEADRKKLRQVVLNLLVNAIKFTDEGSVRLELDRAEDHVHIRVVDTGIGIGPEDRDRIFDRFWQADASSIRTAGGMGIGLWVVRTLTDAMGGTVSLDSTPGEGSTFQVTLPVAPA